MDITQWLILAPALILAILSGYLSERVGIVNIAINGTMIFGAVSFNIFSNIFFQKMGQTDAYNLTFMVSLLLSAIVGIGVGVLFGFAVIKLKCDHVIGGTGINLIAPGIGLMVADNAPLLFNGQSNLANKYNYVSSLNISGGIHGEAIICFAFALLIVAAVYVYMNFTKYGLRYRSIGENPNAADAQGINVNKYKWCGILVASSIASLAGGLFAYYLPGSAFGGDVNGLGFIALALLIVSSWKILPGLVIGLAFSALYVYSVNAINIEADMKFLLRTIPYVLTLIVMILFGRFSIGPKAVGKHFNKSAR